MDTTTELNSFIFHQLLGVFFNFHALGYTYKSQTSDLRKS